MGRISATRQLPLGVAVAGRADVFTPPVDLEVKGQEAERAIGRQASDTGLAS